jgi:Rho GTPase-activating protein 1
MSGMDTEGIFRRSPSSQSLQSTREAYDRNQPKIDLEDAGGIHLACVLMKLFFRELPRPMFEKTMYEELRKVEGEFEKMYFSIWCCDILCEVAKLGAF